MAPRGDSIFKIVLWLLKFFFKSKPPPLHLGQVFPGDSLRTLDGVPEVPLQLFELLQPRDGVARAVAAGEADFQGLQPQLLALAQDGLALVEDGRDVLGHLLAWKAARQVRIFGSFKKKRPKKLKLRIINNVPNCLPQNRDFVLINICRRRTATYIPEGDNSLFLCSKLKFTK